MPPSRNMGSRIALQSAKHDHRLWNLLVLPTGACRGGNAWNRALKKFGSAYFLVRTWVARAFSTFFNRECIFRRFSFRWVICAIEGSMVRCRYVFHERVHPFVRRTSTSWGCVRCEAVATSILSRSVCKVSDKGGSKSGSGTMEVSVSNFFGPVVFLILGGWVNE